MTIKKYLNLFVLSVSSILLRPYNTFKQQMLTQGPLETGTFTSQVSKKPRFIVHENLKGVFCSIN